MLDESVLDDGLCLSLNNGAGGLRFGLSHQGTVSVPGTIASGMAATKWPGPRIANSCWDVGLLEQDM